MARSSRQPGPPLISVGLISAAALAYEILLMRLFSIVHWHHFAYMMISLALLGYGASGTFLALAGGPLRRRYATAFIACAAAFGLTAAAGFLGAQSLPFNALEVLWDERQWLWMLLIYLLLFVPFFFAACCICLTFSQFRGDLHRVYGADLLGAGAGAAGAIALLYPLMPLQVLGVLAVTGVLSAAVAALELGAGTRRTWVALALSTAALLPVFHVELKLSPFKGLAQALRVAGAVQTGERSGPLGLLATVENPVIPFRHAPGMSLGSPVEPPAQVAIFTDGESASVITRDSGDAAALAYLDHVGSALPYHLLEKPEVLVLGAGGGAEVLQALHQGARAVTAVELNPQVTDLVRNDFGEFAGRLYERPGVTVHAGEARGFVASGAQHWDLVQIALIDSFAAASAGLYALNESYLYTVEALGEYLDRLQPGGLLAVTRWLKLPPRDGIKMFVTAVEALERRGVSAPDRHLLMLRTWNTTTLLVATRPFSEQQVAAARRFAEERWFDLVWYPGMPRSAANRFNQLGEPWFYDAAVTLLGEGREAFLRDYKFDLRPATDDRPHFFHFLKWRTLPELVSLRGRGGLPLLEQGYLLIVATLAQALLASLVLLLLPLRFARGEPGVRAGGRGRVAVYFTAIGVAFMFIEIAFIQKFILFLSHPLYAVAVVLAGFLVFAGAGSALSGSRVRPASLWSVVSLIAAVSVSYLLLLPSLFDALAGLDDAWRVAVSLLLIAPLALLMGMPFPLGLDRAARADPAFIPWAWAVNGCASVVSAVLATMLAIHAGFATVVVLALLLYSVAALALPGPGRPERGRQMRDR